MTGSEDLTREKIINAALALFSDRGIVKTSVAEIAFQAGVSRVTVYRHFADKQELVRAVFLRVEQVFQKGLAELEANPQVDSGKVLQQIGDELSLLPQKDVFAAFEELKRLYPEVYQAVQEVRATTLNGIFERLFAIAESQGSLRPGLDRAVVQAIYWELVVNFFDNARFKSFGLSGSELYRAMTDILLHGILK